MRAQDEAEKKRKRCAVVVRLPGDDLKAEWTPELQKQIDDICVSCGVDPSSVKSVHLMGSAPSEKSSWLRPVKVELATEFQARALVSGFERLKKE